MIAIEVKLNGKKLFTAGDDRAESVQASLVLLPQGNPFFLVYAKMRREPTLTANWQWIAEQLSMGDELTLRSVETSLANPPSTKKEYGSPLHPSLERKHTCSFCGKSADEQKRLISGNNANICEHCAEYMFKVGFGGFAKPA